MDRIEQLGSTLSQLTMYDIKSVYNQAKNMVLNVSEMEAKVREATNDDPWGASSTLMQEIAAGTQNFQHFNEIMPCIYSRFMDKEARQWREIYKALQLLEYIIKHGSERVVDDARSHVSTIKMLRNFHYIDEKGKDQGINVRNRAKELTELLMDVDRIRAERRKAKTNRNKYIGTGNDPMSFTGGRYGGFGSDSVGGRSYGGGGYDRDYGGYGGSSSGFRDDRRGFDEYNAGDDEITAPRRSNSLPMSGTSARTTVNQTSAQAASKAPEKVVDLLGFDDDNYSTGTSALPAPATTASGKAAEKALPSNPLDDGDDDFADFQAAPSSAPVSPAPTGANTTISIFDALGSAPSTTVHPYQQQRPNQQSGFVGRPASAMSPVANRTSFTSPPPMSPSLFGGSGVLSPTSASLPLSATPSAPISGVRPGAAPGASPSVAKVTGATARTGTTSVGFDDLWNMSLGTSKPASSATNGSGSGSKSIKDLEKEKTQASIWGGASAQGQKLTAEASSGGLGGVGAGSMGIGGIFGKSASGGGISGSGASVDDDLLL